MATTAAPLPITFSAVELHAGATALLGPLSLTLQAGPPTVLIGPNGAGKSTLLKLAMGLLAPSRGTITWGGDARPPSRELAFVFQRPVMLRRSCAGNIRFALAAAGVVATEREQRTQTLLNLVGLERLADRPSRRLSGGEQQRLALARALARNPAILFLDEPTASLDPGATKGLEDLVRAVSGRGVKVVLATHDLAEAKRLGGEVILLQRGMLVERQPVHEFFTAPATEAARRFIAGDLLV